MEEQKHMNSESKGSDKSAMYMPLAVVVAALFIAVGLYFGLVANKTAPTQAAATGAQAQQPAVDIKDVKTAGEPFIGNANAPIVMAFWSDYQCPFCKAFEVGGVPQITSAAVMPTLIKDYVDTGKIKIVFKDFPFLGNDSNTAAEYARAIWDLYPAQYYTWREAMFKAQDQEGDVGFGNAATIDKLIATIPALDDAKIKAQIVSKKAVYDAAMQADTQEAATFGISGTPAFIIGKTLISGAQPLSAFTAAIDAAK